MVSIPEVNGGCGGLGLRELRQGDEETGREHGPLVCKAGVGDHDRLHGAGCAAVVAITDIIQHII